MTIAQPWSHDCLEHLFQQFSLYLLQKLIEKPIRSIGTPSPAHSAPHAHQQPLAILPVHHPDTAANGHLPKTNMATHSFPFVSYKEAKVELSALPSLNSCPMATFMPSWLPSATSLPLYPHANLVSMGTSWWLIRPKYMLSWVFHLGRTLLSPTHFFDIKWQPW